MNYAKKIVICVNMDIFSEGIIAKISRLHRIRTLWAFNFSYSDTTLKLKV